MTVKEAIIQHGVWALIVLLMVCANILLTAVKTMIEKVEAYLTGGDATKIDPNSFLEKAKAFIAKILGYLSTALDWATGNKEH